MTEPTTLKTHIWSGIKLILAFIIPLTTVLIINTYFIHAYWVPSASMQQTLQIGDRVLGTDTHGDYQPKRGDIIVFEDTQNWLPKNGEETYNLVKRVIGLPGDTIQCCSPEGQIIINGTPIDETYIGSPNQTFQPQTVPEGHVFVLGDNRAESADSAYHIPQNTQFIPTKTVKAKIFFTYWPYQNIGPEN